MTNAEIRTISAEEKETIARYDYQEKKWYIHTSVPTHITKLTKLSNSEPKALSMTENGTPTEIMCELEKNQISFRNLSNRTMSEEQKELARVRLQEARNNFKS